MSRKPTPHVEPFRVTVRIATPNRPDVIVTVPILTLTAVTATRAVINGLCSIFDDCEITEGGRDVSITR